MKCLSTIWYATAQTTNGSTLDMAVSLTHGAHIVASTTTLGLIFSSPMQFLHLILCLLAGALALPMVTDEPFNLSDLGVNISSETLNDLTLFKQTGVYSLPPVEYNSKPIKRIRVASCDAITKSQMGHLMDQYPNFLVTCEKEMTLLYPSELDDEFQEKLTLSDTIQKTFGKYQLTELAVILVKDSEMLKVLLSPCIYLSKNTTSGALEFKFTISGGAGTQGSVTVGAPIPHLGIKTSLGSKTTLVKSFVLDHSCTFKGYGVRPVVSLATVETRIQNRKWQVTRFPKFSWVKSKWDKRNQKVFTDDGPIFSCVSELYVPGVCRWPSDRAREEDGEEVRVIDIQ